MSTAQDFLERDYTELFDRWQGECECERLGNGPACYDLGKDDAEAWLATASFGAVRAMVAGGDPAGCTSYSRGFYDRARKVFEGFQADRAGTSDPSRMAARRPA